MTIAGSAFVTLNAIELEFERKCSSAVYDTVKLYVPTTSFPSLTMFVKLAVSIWISPSSSMVYPVNSVSLSLIFRLSGLLAAGTVMLISWVSP